MREAVARRDWEDAELASRQALIEEPGDPDLITLAAGIAAFQDRKREAAKMLVEAAEVAEYQPLERIDSAVRGLMDVGEIYAAIELLETSLKQFPERDAQRQVLVGFYNEVQRGEMVPPHLWQLIKRRHFSLPLLLTTTERSSRRLSDSSSQRLLERNPHDHRVRLSEAFLSLYRRDFVSAAGTLQQILEHHPDFAPAYAMYGQALSGMLRFDEFDQWVSNAPVGVRNYADYWLTIGDFLANQRQLDQATRAYWEACQRDPARGLAWDRLRLSAMQLKESESENADLVTDTALAAIEAHAKGLIVVRDAFNDFCGNSKDSQRAATKVARGLLDVGRTWEAEAWSALALNFKNEPSPDLSGLREQIIATLRQDASWVSKSTSGLQVDFSFLPEPELGQLRFASSDMLVPELLSHDHIRLRSSGNDWGLQSIGIGNDPSDPKLAPLIRSTGAGGGMLDYDLDGFADLIVVNAGGTMLQADSMPNQLLRNDGRQFYDVSDQAAVADRRFGQGVSVGDFNEDGFPDLFIANLGVNQLLRNNGDGSFTDCSSLIADSVAAQWSTSAAFADLNRDGLADLFVAQYCQAVDSLKDACPNKAGEPGPCHPMVFAGDVDQVYESLGSGEFENVSQRWFADQIPGRGLGVLAGRLDKRQMGVFVANDMTRNAYYIAPAASETKLEDRATASGIAVDGQSLAQASMGIAASDFDHDGDLDLYVTGFGREYNIFYEQVVPGVWEDATAKLGLVEPTLSWVGFGTQAIDLDNDGLDELVVTNGNIGQFAEPGADRYEQPLQVFRRGDQGRFEELEDDSWGEYFKRDHVGRALWTSDVNRDGRNDLFVTETRSSIGLLINETKTEGHVIAFQVIGTNSSRDAVGTVIEFYVNGTPRTLWRLAGDGYLCSNEKQLLCGLGSADQVTEVKVTWPDGSIESLGRLEADRAYLIVEGQREAFESFQY
ncbi:FG-GAP-like repeat-containing protein [Roseiconus lacunae]|uniref:FG-GAP-like repeat-containing protein n=1 Tax=Roseiconus lacunae TaxID=2605694 RepID=UPI00309197D6|nr:FG-GAP-like repeat-containing protein [Stieleria sp. HD01]